MNKISLPTIVWFLRPTLGVVICYLVALGASYVISENSVDEFNESLVEIRQLADRISDLKQPTLDLSPKQVVEIQAGAMADDNVQRSVLQCAIFASPDNFAVTGPLDRFAAMLRSPEFASLSSPAAIVVGDPVFRDDVARVLVSVVANKRTHAYVWVLERQTDGRLQGCWLTDAVFPVRSNNGLSDNEI